MLKQQTIPDLFREQYMENERERERKFKNVMSKIKKTDKQQLLDIEKKLDKFNYEDIVSDVTGLKKQQYEYLIKQRRSLIDEMSEPIRIERGFKRIEESQREANIEAEEREQLVKREMKEIKKIKKQREEKERKEREEREERELSDQGVIVIGGRPEIFGDIIPESGVRRPRYRGGVVSGVMLKALEDQKITEDDFIDSTNDDVEVFIDLKIPILSSLGNIGVINAVSSAFQAQDVLIYNFISFYDNQVKFYQPPVYDEKDIETINLIKKEYIKIKSEGKGLTYEDNLLYMGSDIRKNPVYLKIPKDNLYTGLLRLSVFFKPLLKKLEQYNNQSIERELQVNNDYQFINSNKTVQDLENLNMFKDPILRQQKIKEYEEKKVDILGDMVNMEDVDKIQALNKFNNENLISEIQYAKIVYNDENKPLSLEDMRILNKINQEKQNKFLLDWEKKKYGVSPLNAQGSKDPSVINAFNQITQSMLNNSITNEKVREIQNLNTAKNPNLKYTYTYPFGIPSSEIKIEKGRFCVYQDGKKTEFSDYFKARLYALSGGVYEKKLKSLTNAKQLVSLEPKKFNLIPFVIK